MIIVNSNEIDIDHPRNAFEKFYSFVWRKYLTKSDYVIWPIIDRFLNQELSAFYATASLVDNTFVVEFDSDNEYVLFNLTWS